MTAPKRSQETSPATMADIARRAGVSKVTVSAVLSASAGNHTRVAAATRQRILDAAQELNYAPNGIARMFRRRSTDIVGLYLGDWLLNTHDLFLAEIVSGLQIGCHENRKDLLIHGTFRGRSVDDIYLELISQKIDGLILFTQPDDPLAARLAASALPVVAITDAVPVLPSVVADDRAGSRLIAEYLAARGHRRVLYRRGRSFQTSASRRYEAFQEAAGQFGMTVAQDFQRLENFAFVLSTQEQALLAQEPSRRPTAIVCSNDLLAYAAVEYCLDRNLRVPEDVAVAGFDGIMPQVRPAARLTT
ncbi:MAG: LacI family transcriptional regulator, partial [Armatimonadota bacterium]|nr:LacI family transcriptional regulator [Armatimonadota bacterium]